MDSTDRTARTAGLLYLLVVVSGIFSLGYVPSRLIVRADPSTTINNIVASDFLFRSGIAAGLICQTCFLLLPLVLYRLLAPVHKTCAVLMVAFAVTSVPISYVNILNQLSVLSLLGGGNNLPAHDTNLLHAQVMFLLDAYRSGTQIVKIFWGLWLLPFGYLVYKSGFLPRALGILLMIGCCSYLLEFFGRNLFMLYTSGPFATAVKLPASIAEIGTCLWLLLVGARPTLQHVMPGAAGAKTV